MLPLTAGPGCWMHRLHKATTLAQIMFLLQEAEEALAPILSLVPAEFHKISPSASELPQPHTYAIYRAGRHFAAVEVPNEDRKVTPGAGCC